MCFFCGWLLSLIIMFSRASHPTVDAHFGCFYLVTIMNNSAMNICIQFFVYVSIHPYLRMDLLCHMVDPFLTF